MSARAIYDQKANPQETFAQPAAEQITHFFATETVSGKDADPPITDQLDCPPPEIANREIHTQRPLPPSGTTSFPRVDVLADEEIHAKRGRNGEVARIAVKAKDRIIFVNPTDVVVAKAQGNYVALMHRSGCYLVRETMAIAEQKLAPLGFVRIHRSILVNTTLVKDLRRDHTGTYVLRTTDGREHPVGRAYKRNLKMIARSWLGAELE